MAGGWLTTYGASNKIILAEDSHPDTFVTLGGVPVVHTRTLTISKYKYVGMTHAAAVTCQATENDPANDVFATMKREGPGGNFMVEVTETTATAWA
jgi:hypothetical protein